MKKIFTLITLFFMILFTFVPKTMATEVNKIISANFDTSNAMFVISAKDNANSAIVNDINLINLENPKRTYFDIDNAILTIPKQDWTFNAGPIKQIKITQFSTSPNKVRVVMYFDDDYNAKDINFLRLKNNIIIKTKNNNMCNNQYFQNTYRDEHSSSGDYYEYLTITSPTNIPDDNVVGQIHEAFNSIDNNTEKKELKLNTQFYLNNVSLKQNAVLLNGFGGMTIERPMILSNPSRIVYDISNTLVNTDIRNREYKLNETDSVKIGQFSVNKARIVITTNDVNDYIPIFSSDNQSLLLANYKKINNNSLYNNTSNAIGYSKEKNDERTNSMVLFFEHPIVHGVDRLNNQLIVYLYNVSKYSEDSFRATFAGTPFEKAQISLIPQIGLKFAIPLEQDSLVSTYLSADSKVLKVKVQAPKKKPAVIITPPASVLIPKPKTQTSNKKKVVLDPGHGGSDSGAIGGGTNEKDINLDVAKKVENLLEKQGYTVLMTRTGDPFVSLQDRVAMSENFNPDIFVSIHVNSSVRPEITGVETHYYHQESLALAQTVHSSLASAVQSPNRGLFKSKFYVINHTTAPAILVEIGFISNSSERSQLVGEKRKQATAKAIAEGVQNYFKQCR